MRLLNETAIKKIRWPASRREHCLQAVHPQAAMQVQAIPSRPARTPPG